MKKPVPNLNFAAAFGFVGCNPPPVIKLSTLVIFTSHKYTQNIESRCRKIKKNYRSLMAAPIRVLILIVIPVKWQDDITSATNHKGNMHPIRVSQNVLSNRL